ncbi:MAG: ABC transporter permease [Desulfovibrio sp.]|nr:ABC transporter permease [Desulfovibrio sp.]
MVWNFCIPVAGPFAFLLFWWCATHLLSDSTPMAAYFMPEKAWQAALHAFDSGVLVGHTIDSLRRVFVGLLLALGVGIPIGLLVGSSRIFDRASNLFFQLLRMISPLSWMPLAVIILGIGDAPVYFLLGFAGVWPIILSVASGVAAIDPKWLNLAKSMAASKTEVLFHIIFPGIMDHILTGARLAVGVIWIVLVPAEMLGVQAGLGYFILDARDRMEYGDLVLTILYIGVLGAIIDYFARWLRQKWQAKYSNL